MDKRPILFVDSGIGALPYGHYFRLRNPGESLVYASDRAHFPYGLKKREELIKILVSLTRRLIDSFNPKLMAVACNTASVSALAELRNAFPCLPFVGTVPAIKPAILESRTRRIGVLGTKRTIADPYIRKLAARYGRDCALIGIAAPDLVEFVEHRCPGAGPAERLEAVRPYIEQFRAEGADAVVLGCTHFLILLEEFRTAGAEHIRIYDSLDGVSRRLEALLDQDEKSLRAATGDPLPQGGKNSGVLVLTGQAPPESPWRERAEFFDLSLRLLEDTPVLSTPGTA
jgi:glutamate racemase